MLQKNINQCKKQFFIRLFAEKNEQQTYDQRKIAVYIQHIQKGQRRKPAFTGDGTENLRSMQEVPAGRFARIAVKRRSLGFAPGFPCFAALQRAASAAWAAQSFRLLCGSFHAFFQRHSCRRRIKSLSLIKSPSKFRFPL